MIPRQVPDSFTNYDLASPFRSTKALFRWRYTTSSDSWLAVMLGMGSRAFDSPLYRSTASRISCTVSFTR